MIRHFQFENSSMLSSCDYNDESEELTVTFTNGKSYTYIDVPRRTYDELIDAKSAGKYFNLVKSQLKQKQS
jgi:hypothetical protein